MSEFTASDYHCVFCPGCAYTGAKLEADVQVWSCRLFEQGKDCRYSDDMIEQAKNEGRY